MISIKCRRYFTKKIHILFFYEGVQQQDRDGQPGGDADLSGAGQAARRPRWQDRARQILQALHRTCIQVEEENYHFLFPFLIYCDNDNTLFCPKESRKKKSFSWVINQLF